MKIGMNLLLWTGSVTDEHVPVLEEIAQLGYDGVEFPVFSHDFNTFQKMKGHLDRLGLGSSIVTCVPPEANPISDDPAVRKAAVEFMKNSIEVASILGSDIVAGPFTAPVGLLTRCPRTDDEWKHGVEVMQQVAEIAGKANVTLALEALNRFETYFLNTMEDTCRFVDEVGSKNLQVMWDTFHANIEEADQQKALESVGDRLAHVHISENNRAIPGEGHIDYDATFNALKKLNYDGWLTIEAFGTALPELAGATCIWRKMFGSNHELAEKGFNFLKGRTD